MTGIELIAAERRRQVEWEGWTAEHDDTHSHGELADAAACYASICGALVRGATADDFHVADNLGDALTWPWSDEDWKPTDDPIRNLVKAGALIAAEIDRLQRLAAARPDTGEVGR